MVRRWSVSVVVGKDLTHKMRVLSAGTNPKEIHKIHDCLTV